MHSVVAAHKLPMHPLPGSSRYLRDDYRTTPVLTFATAAPERSGAPQSPHDRYRALLNGAVGWSRLGAYSTAVVPVYSSGFDTSRLPLSSYNTSAIGAVALETATLSYRLAATVARDPQHGRRMAEVADMLLGHGQSRSIPLCSLAVAAPLDWHALASRSSADGGGSGAMSRPPGQGLGPEVAEMFTKVLASHNPRSASYMHSLAPQQPNLHSTSSRARWDASACRMDPVDIFTVRGLARQTVVPRMRASGPSPQAGSFRSGRGGSTWLCNDLPLPLCFPRIFCQKEPCAPSGHSEPEPEASADAAPPAINEIATATRLSNSPVDLISSVLMREQAVQRAKARPIAAVLAAVDGGTGDGEELLEDAGERLSSLRLELSSSFKSEQDSDDDCSEDD
jgi:hypothetical protein